MELPVISFFSRFFFSTLCPWVTTAASVLGCLRFGALRILHLRPLRHSSWASRWGVLGEDRRAKRVLQNWACIHAITIYTYIWIYMYALLYIYTHNVCICAICMWCITKRWDVLCRSQRILCSDPDSIRLGSCLICTSISGTQSWSVVRIEHDLYTPIQQTKIIYTIDIPLIYHWYTIDIPLIYHWYTIDIPLIYHWYACPVDSHDRFFMIQFFPPEDAEDSGGEQCGATLSRYVCNFAIRDAQYRTSAIPRFKHWGSPAAPFEKLRLGRKATSPGVGG